MPFVLDESSYRVDKTVFPTAEEAEQRAAEAARVLGRAINVYELLDQMLNFAFRVLPDGSVEEDNPLTDPATENVAPTSPAVLGTVLDDVAEVLEQRSSLDLAAEVDAFAEVITAPEASIMMTASDDLKRKQKSQAK